MHAYGVLVQRHDKGARTAEEIAAKSTLPKTSKLQLNCSRSPMFDFIPMPHVVIDLLHLFLRVSDVLTNLLIRDFLILDGLEKCSDRSKAVNVNNYESNLNEKCNIQFQFHVEKVSKKLVWHDLTGPEKNLLFSNIDIPNWFPNHRKKEKVQLLWMSFFSLIRRLSKKDCNPVEFDKDAKEWVKLFISTYQKKDATLALGCMFRSF